MPEEPRNRPADRTAAARHPNAHATFTRADPRPTHQDTPSLPLRTAVISAVPTSEHLTLHLGNASRSTAQLHERERLNALANNPQQRPRTPISPPETFPK
jgi:hypothetical protein